MAPSKIQFVYFNAKGRGEKVRWVLAQSGVEWEDKRMVDGEWATLKPSMYSVRFKIAGEGSLNQKYIVGWWPCSG